MIPKTPNSYRIPQPIRFEIIALMSDLDLVFVRKTFVPLPPGKIWSDLTSSRLCPLLDNQPIKSGISCRDFMERNHHYKNFKNVYPSDNNNAQGSFSWD